MSKTFTAVISVILPSVLYFKSLDIPCISWPVKSEVFKKYILFTFQSIIQICIDYWNSMLYIMLTVCLQQCNNITYSNSFSYMLCKNPQITGEFMKLMQYWYCKMASSAIAARCKWFSVTFLARKWKSIVLQLRRANDVTGKGWRGQQGGKGVSVLEEL